MLNLTSLLEHSAQEYPERTALVLGDTRLTYAELLSRSQDIADALSGLGVGRGDKVALSCPNVPDFPAAYFGILRAGAVVVPLNVLLRPQEVAYHLTDSRAKALLCFEGTPQLPLAETGKAGFDQAPDCEHFLLLHRIEHTSSGSAEPAGMVATEAEDTAVILYTSGTTGRPKGAELTHRNMAMNAMVADRLFTAAEDEVMLASLPLFHAFGQSAVMNMGLLRGATLVLQPRFDAEEALRLMHREGVTFFAGVPTMYWALLRRARIPRRTGTARAPAYCRLRGCRPARRSAPAVREGLRCGSAGGVRTVGDLARRLLQPARTAAQARVHRYGRCGACR